MALVVFIAAGFISEPPARAQTAAKQKSTVKSKPSEAVPGVCPDSDAMLACKSFRQLLDAHDTDLLDSIKPTSYVCFRPKEDRFFVFRYT
jgi:hypothetical protein